MSAIPALSTGSPNPRRTPASNKPLNEENIKVGKEDTSTANVSDVLTRLLRYVSDYCGLVKHIFPFVIVLIYWPYPYYILLIG